MEAHSVWPLSGGQFVSLELPLLADQRPIGRSRAVVPLETAEFNGADWRVTVKEQCRPTAAGCHRQVSGSAIRLEVLHD